MNTPARPIEELVVRALFGRMSDAHLELARQLLRDLGGVPGLFAAGVPALLANGVSLRDAQRLVALVELVGQPVPAEGVVLTSAADVARVMSPMLKFAIDERFIVICVDRRRRMLVQLVGTIGSASFTVVDPSQIFRIAVVHRAASVILVHNHPSGDPTPSAQDVEVTRRIARAGQLIGIPVLDHVVIGGEGHCSLAERGEVPYSDVAAPPWAP